MQCQVCNSEMKLIKAGISKSTGNPYNAFWACSNKCKQNSFVTNAEISKQTPVPTSSNQSPDWDKINETKQLGIHWEVCLKLAGEAFIAGKIEKENIPVMTNWLFELEPNKKQQPF